MLIGMSNEQRRGWRELETYEEAAVRLLRVLNERTEKRKVAGHLKAPAEIQGSCESLQEKRPEPSNMVGNIAAGSGQFTDAEGGADSSGLDGWRGLSPVETRCDAFMRPPAQPCAGSNESGFTVDAGGPRARNVRTDSTE